MMPAEIQAPRIVAISTSDSPDMDALGLSECHLREAVAEFAIHLLASGANLAYGGDLRQQSFTELLFELVMRYRQQEETEARVTDYLAWPVHIRMTVDDLDKHNAKLLEFAQLVLIGQDGSRMSMEDRQMLPSREPTDSEWSAGLTSMRQAMCRETGARIVLGGRVEGYKGDMPGIAEEALLSFRAGQPLFLVGGFGGCTCDIAEAVRLVDTRSSYRPAWPGRHRFERYGPDDLHNGLSIEENRVLARTSHIEQAVFLVMLGLRRLRGDIQYGSDRGGE